MDIYINEFIKNFADQFDDTDASEIKEETVFHDLEEWSSLTALSVLNMSEKKYGVKLTFEELKSIVTVGQLSELIRLKT